MTQIHLLINIDTISTEIQKEGSDRFFLWVYTAIFQLYVFYAIVMVIEEMSFFQTCLNLNFILPFWNSRTELDIY